MNWDAIAFDWNQVRAFLATAEEGSLSAAARVLRQTQPTLGRQVTALEQELGVALFERIGKRLELTPAGREMLEHVRAMGDAATQLSLMASGRSQAIDGLVRITASDVLSAYMLPRFLVDLRRAAPLIEIDVVAANDLRDLQRREADIAIRHVRPEQPDLIARLVQTGHAYFYATSEYLRTYGRPETYDDLSGHQFITFGDADEMIAYMAPLGIHLTRENFRMGSKSGIVAWQMARAGHGIAVMSQALGNAAPEMKRLLPGAEPIAFPVWLTTHRELHTSRRIRVVFDMLDTFLSNNPV